MGVITLLTADIRPGEAKIQSSPLMTYRYDISHCKKGRQTCSNLSQEAGVLSGFCAKSDVLVYQLVFVSREKRS
jgi:hypothetical protein